MNTAIIVLSNAGLGLARRLRGLLAAETTIFAPACVVGMCSDPSPSAEGESSAGARVFAATEPAVRGWRGPLRLVFPEIWEDFDAIVGVMALGIVVRLVGPLASDKRTDPIVVVLDEGGRFAISVLAGHSGGNELAQRVASALGANPVITTASDAHGLPTVDQIGRDLGWKIESSENLTRVAAAVVRREKIAVYQDAGSADWWRRFGRWPSHFLRIESFNDPVLCESAGALIISDRVIPEEVAKERVVIYRPPTLVVGVGCKRGASLTTIEELVDRVFAENGLSAASLAAFATVDLKADEPGLVALAQKRGVPLIAYALEDLASQPGTENPSERVRSKIGIPAVAEPAALRGAGATRLLDPKRKGNGVTVAVARKSNS
jgi:cobalt-precorrin 5A hydrolase